MSINDKVIYTPREVAAITGVTRLTVYRWIKSGKLPAVKFGQWKVHRMDLARMLNRI